MYLSGGIQLLVVVCCIGHCKPYKYGIYWETFVTLFLSRGVNKIFQRMTKYFVRLLPFAFSTLSRFFFFREISFIISLDVFGNMTVLGRATWLCFFFNSLHF